MLKFFSLSGAWQQLDACKGSFGHDLVSIHNGHVIVSLLMRRSCPHQFTSLRFSMSLTGAELIQDCTIELTIGRRYGLLGMNGSGKSNFLKCLAAREVRCVEIHP